jgi:putative nucleotidyltransferase with HDIG domain
MDLSGKSKSRRQEIRKNRPDAVRIDWQGWKEKGIPQSVGLAGVFFVLAAAILCLRQDVVQYRPGQPITHDIRSRVQFGVTDPAKLAEEQEQARRKAPRVYAPDEKAWDELEADLLSVPARVTAAGAGDPPADLAAAFKDPGVRSLLRNAGAPAKRDDAGTLTDAGLYEQAVRTFVRSLADYRKQDAPNFPLVLLLADDRVAEVGSDRKRLRVGPTLVDVAGTYAADDRRDLPGIVRSLVEKAGFPSGAMQLEVAEYALRQLRPTHKLDVNATTQAGNEAAQAIRAAAAYRYYAPGDILVFRSRPDKVLNDADILKLRAENAAYLSSLPGSWWKPRLGTAVIALVVTGVMGAYVAAFQPRVVKNQARGVAIVALLLSMLLLAALVGIGNGPIYLFGIAPTLLVGMILAIAYDRRFAIGVASLHGLLATVALAQSAPFFLVVWVGVLVSGFLLDDVRTRSKLVEVGGAAALTMMVATAAAGLLTLESGNFMLNNCLYAGAAGLAAGFVVLGILPFVERTFRITTSMTLLELGDCSQPLLRRLQMEALGTYNHSMQVANLAESAAESIGADSLLCRVASYYHDVGKINKPDYFVENQTGGHNRHLNLDPNLSQLIIVAHVKDGVELGREYNLPNSVLPFIQQHHGTTIVEYFYRRACTQQEQRDPTTHVSESQFRYPGPRPRTKEVAIVMICDAVESATRAMDDPSPAQIEGLVRDLTLKRLLDGQFDECDITMKDLDRIKRSLVKTLAGIYHGRIPYPPSATTPGPHPSSGGGGSHQASDSQAGAAVRSA